MGLRIIQRVREEYGDDAEAHVVEEMNPFTNPSRSKKALQADTSTTPNGGTFSHADDEEGIGGGFLADDDDFDGGGLLPEGHDEVKVPRGAGELTIEDERAPVNSSPSSDFLPVNLDVLNNKPPEDNDSGMELDEASLEGRITNPEKTSTNSKKNKPATVISGPESYIPSNSSTKRVAPKRKASRKSETALKSDFFEHESDENDDKKSQVSEEVAVVQSRPKQRNRKDGPSTRVKTLRARKST